MKAKSRLGNRVLSESANVWLFWLLSSRAAFIYYIAYGIGELSKKHWYLFEFYEILKQRQVIFLMLAVQIGQHFISIFTQFINNKNVKEVK